MQSSSHLPIVFTRTTYCRSNILYAGLLQGCSLFEQ